MNTQPVLLNNLTGAALNWAVAQALGLSPVLSGKTVTLDNPQPLIDITGTDAPDVFNPSDDVALCVTLMTHIGIDARQYRQAPHSRYLKSSLLRNNGQLRDGDIIDVAAKGSEWVLRPNAPTDMDNKFFARPSSSSGQVGWSKQRDPMGDTLVLAVLRQLVCMKGDNTLVSHGTTIDKTKVDVPVSLTRKRAA